MFTLRFSPDLTSMKRGFSNVFDKLTYNNVSLRSMSTMYSINNESGNLKNGSANGSKDDQNCQAIDKNTGEPCGEIKGFQVLSEFQKLYEDRIGKVDLEFEGELDRVSIKLQLMTKWVKDLEEQNVMLVQTVEDMEQAACSSVRLLEEKLMQSSKMMTENLSRSSEAEETLNFLSGRISILEKDEECLQQKVEFLQSDIRSLLELIRRARQENCWNIKGITFFEIQPQDIPVPVDCNCPPTNANDHTDIEVIQDLKLQIEQLKINETKALAYQKDLENKLADMTVELTAKEETIQKYVSKLEAFDSNLNKHSELTSQYTSSIDHIKSNIVLKTEIGEQILIQKDKEIKNLKQQLQDTEAKFMAFKNENILNLNHLRLLLDQKFNKQRAVSDQKESLETWKMLTCKVTEKCDIVACLQKEITKLQDQLSNANLQILFKEDIIKEMRKKLKELVYSIVSPCMQYYHSEIILDDKAMEHSYKSNKKCIQLRMLYASADAKKKTPVLDTQGIVEFRKTTVDLLPIDNKERDSMVKNMYRHQNSVQNKNEQHRQIHDIDKEIIDIAKRLSLPSKVDRIKDTQ